MEKVTTLVFDHLYGNHFLWSELCYWAAHVTHLHLKTKIKLRICQILISLLLYLSLCSNLSQFYFFRGGFNYWIVLLYAIMLLLSSPLLYVKSFFPHTAWLGNPLPIECFPLTYDLSLELTDTFELWVLSKQISCMLKSFYASFYNPMHGVNPT